MDCKISAVSYNLYNGDKKKRRKILKVSELYKAMTNANKVQLLIEVFFSAPNFNLEYNMGMIFCKPFYECDGKIHTSTSPVLKITLPLDNVILNSLRAYPKIIFLYMIMQQENCTNPR